MTRLIFSGVLEKNPNLKILTHHCGGTVPFYAERIRQFQNLGEMRWGLWYYDRLTKKPLNDYKMFYADTAKMGTRRPSCAATPFRRGSSLFGIDALGDMEDGYRKYRQTENAIDEMEISDEDRKKIYVENARRFYRLPA